MKPLERFSGAQRRFRRQVADELCRFAEEVELSLIALHVPNNSL